MQQSSIASVLGNLVDNNGGRKSQQRSSLLSPINNLGQQHSISFDKSNQEGLSVQKNKEPNSNCPMPMFLATGSMQTRSLAAPKRNDVAVRRSHQFRSTRLETSPYTSGSNPIIDSNQQHQQLSDAVSNIVSRNTETAKAVNHSRQLFNQSEQMPSIGTGKYKTPLVSTQMSPLSRFKHQ